MTKDDNGTRSNLSVYLMVAGAVALLAFFFPQVDKESESIVEIGTVWEEPDLVVEAAPELLESTIDRQQIEEEIRAEHIDIYSWNLEQLADDVRTLEKGIASQLDSTSNDLYTILLNKGREYIREVYSDGVIAEMPESFPIRLSANEKIVTRDREGIHSIQSVFNDIPSTWTERERAFLVPIIKDVIEPNVVYDQDLNEKYILDQLEKQINAELLKPGEILVEQGARVDVETKERIQRYRSIQEPAILGIQNYWLRYLGYLLLTSLILTIFILYIKNHDPYILHSPKRLLFMLIWPVLFGLLIYFIEGRGELSSYMIPFCIVPIIVRTFTNSRLALFTHVVVILIASILSSLGYEFTFLQILAGIVAVLFVKETRDWSEFFASLLMILLSYVIGYFGVTLILDGSIREIEIDVYLWFLVNVILLLLAYPLIPLLERIFGFTTSIRLNELSDLNKPLLKQMSIEAPGTLQHSLQVSNLSQAAAEAIGANVDLIKVGALYHDIGKMKRPKCFIENQSGENPHEQMNSFESARAIIEHVTEGEVMAKSAKLPQDIIDFITTHHGTTRVEYFYRKLKQEDPEREFDESLFRYPGPKPWTKEQTVMMMADSLEAASKSLKSPTGKDIDTLVDKIIQGKISSGQFDDSPLTFSDLEKCKEVFRNLLRSINHVRVEYPEE